MLVAFDKAVQQRPGNMRIDEQPRDEKGRVRAKAKDRSVYKVNNTEPERPAGNSAQAAIRRLRKATDAGDTKAADLLDQVEAGGTSPNAAAVAMGWRRKMVSLPDEPEALFAALVARVGIAGIRRPCRPSRATRRSGVIAMNAPNTVPA